MKKVFICLIGFLICLPFSKLKAQTATDKEVPHHPLPKRGSVVQQKKSVNSTNPYPTMRIDEEDQYMGREKEFLNIMTVSALPADFPKYSRSLGLEGYSNTVEYYFKQHPDLLKDKWKQKLKYN
jgi:hypothetical protein